MLLKFECVPTLFCGFGGIADVGGLNDATSGEATFILKLSLGYIQNLLSVIV
jgi:hypothetical protein